MWGRQVNRILLEISKVQSFTFIYDERSYMTQPRFFKILLCYVHIWRWNRSIFNSDFHVFGHGIGTYLSFSLYKNEYKHLNYQNFRAARQTKEKYPKRDSAVTLQADFSENPDDIVALVRAIEGGSDIVAGSMKLPDSKFSILRSIPRLLTEILLGKVYHEAPVGDPFCGFRAYRLIVLKKAFNASKKRPLVTSKGWLANLELLSVLAPHARRVSDIRKYKALSQRIYFLF